MMKPPAVLRFALLASVALVLVPRPAAPQKIDLRLGLWEMTTVVDMGGTPPVDTSQMTPEQRQKLAAMLEQTKKMRAQPHTTQSCLTKEKLSKLMLPEERSSSCKPTVLTDTSTEYAVKFACSAEGGNQSGEWHFQAITPTSVKGTGQITLERAAQKMTSTSTITAKWVAESCGNVK